MFFHLPQRPYFTAGNLRDQVTYPDASPSDHSKLDQQLITLLHEVNLGHLISRYHTLDAIEDWTTVLSGGEKERLCMARLFYHNPVFGLLDESTSAVSAEIEHKLYKMCIDKGITLLTVAHRPALRKFHQKEIHIKVDGTYDILSIEH